MKAAIVPRYGSPGVIEVGDVPAPGRAFVNELRDRIEAGRFIPVIHRRYPLAAIADAYRYVQTGGKAGVVVIDLVTEGQPLDSAPLGRKPLGGREAGR